MTRVKERWRCMVAEVAWWHANNFPQHRFADVFGDVIGNVRASGGIGEMADDCVRGAVDV